MLYSGTSVSLGFSLRCKSHRSNPHVLLCSTWAHLCISGVSKQKYTKPLSGRSEARRQFRAESVNGVCDVSLSSEEILKLSDIVQADSEILLQNQIAVPVSSDMARVYREYAPQDNAIIQVRIACLCPSEPRCKRARE